MEQPAFFSISSTTVSYIYTQIAQTNPKHDHVILSFSSLYNNSLSIITLPCTVKKLDLLKLMIKYKLYFPKSLTHLEMRVRFAFDDPHTNYIILHRNITHFTLVLDTLQKFCLNLTNGLKYLMMDRSYDNMKLSKTLECLIINGYSTKIKCSKMLRNLKLYSAHGEIQLSKSLIYINIYIHKFANNFPIPKQLKYLSLKNTCLITSILLNKSMIHLEYMFCEKIIFSESLQWLSVITKDVQKDYELPNNLELFKITCPDYVVTRYVRSGHLHKFVADLYLFLPNSIKYLVKDFYGSKPPVVERLNKSNTVSTVCAKCKCVHAYFMDIKELRDCDKNG